MRRVAPVALLAMLFLMLPATHRTTPPEAPREAPSEEGRGLLVEEVRPGFAAARTALLPGDRVVAWRRAGEPDGSATGGPLGSPFELLELEVGTAPLEPVTLVVRRSTATGSTRLSIPMPPGKWGLRVRPSLPGPIRALYLEALERVDSGHPAEAMTLARRAAAAVADEGRRLDAGWLLSLLGEDLDRLGAGAEAEALHRHALERVRAVGDGRGDGSVATAVGSLEARAPLHLEERLARSLETQGRIPEEAEIHRRLLPRWRLGSTPLARLATARILDLLGHATLALGDLTTAGELHRQALEIHESLVPGGLPGAGSLNKLGIVAGHRGDLAAAGRYFQRALARYEEAAPESRDAANMHNNLSVFHARSGDLGAAERHLRRFLALWRKIEPESSDLAVGWSNLGELALLRGDRAMAEKHFLRALDLQRRLAPASLDVAATLSMLGKLTLSRHDLDGAEAYSRRSLALLERIGPEGPFVPEVLDQLGTVERRRGDGSAAERLYRRSLELRRLHGPEGVDVASSLERLAGLDLDRGRGATAAEHLREALRIRRRASPGGPFLATTLCRLGEASVATGRPREAEALFREGLEHLDRDTPHGPETARCRHQLARLLRGAGRRQEALSSFERALADLEAQTARLGGSYETRSRFASAHTDLYRDALDLLVEMGRTDQAFHVLERSRARSFLTLLATRDLDFSRDVPEELLRGRQRADAAYDRTLAALTRPDPDLSDPERQALRAALAEARHDQQVAEARLRAAAPRLAALRHPEPLTRAAAQAMLEPGTLLLSYSLGEERSHLFVLGSNSGSGVSGPLDVFVLPVGRDVLRAEIARFRALLAPHRSARAITAAGRRLSGRLLGPVADRLPDARRLILIPDGPLHDLPFAALPLPSPAGPAEKAPTGDPRWLVEVCPLSVAASATVLSQLRARPPASGPPTLTAFGDPVYPEAPERSPQALTLRSALGWNLDRALSLPPLPATRTEVEGLTRLFPDRSQVFLGPEATEERAKSLDPDRHLLHFACHGVLNERFPLESALALTFPSGPSGDDPDPLGEQRENGLLQAWEIFEQMRADAELVTLSACDTGLGKTLAGEGMVGLTRAFHHAGARSVLASLWAVGDHSTSLLMTSFYRHLQEGRAQDEALRRAQLDLLHGTAGRGTYRHPFHWAAFQLFGDPG